MRHSQKLLIAAVVGLVFQAAAVKATVFIVAEPERLLKASDAVVVGTVVGIETVSGAGGVRTNIQLEVEQALKAAVPGNLTLVESGGSVGAQSRWTFGAPTYFINEKVLAFVKQGSDGSLHTTYLGMGKFRIVRSSSGSEFVVRNLTDGNVVDPRNGHVARSHSTSYRLEDLWARLEEQPQPRRARRLVSRDAVGTQHQARFSFTGPPALRWFVDKGQAVQYSIDPAGDVNLGAQASLAAAQAALAAWSNVPCADLQLAGTADAVAAPFADCDGRSQILFNDPFDEVQDPTDCVGILAIGGVCGDQNDARGFAGGTYFRMTEGDVMVNNGFAACQFWNEHDVAEVLTHEIGHTLGLAHSSDDPSEPDSVLRGATMYYRAHFDGRGAALEDDDRAAICALHPSGSTGNFEMRALALVSDPKQRPLHDRLSFNGRLQIYLNEPTPLTHPLIVSLRVNQDILLRINVTPSEWRQNSTGTRFRYRSRSADGAVSVNLIALGDSRYEMQVHASGLDLTSAPGEQATLTVNLGEAGAIKPIAFRNGARARLYP